MSAAAAGFAYFDPGPSDITLLLYINKNNNRVKKLKRLADPHSSVPDRVIIIIFRSRDLAADTVRCCYTYRIIRAKQ